MTPAPRSRLRLTSLLLVEERLLEAEHFASRLFNPQNSIVLGYELNAFLSAARSVTFLLQKEFANVEGFQAWWGAERAALGADKAARFFLEMRNFSQKEGRVAFVGTSSDCRNWRYMFGGASQALPDELLNRDVADCCLDHVAKLARTIMKVATVFPYQSCPARALTPAGVAALGLDMNEVEAAILGLPPEFLAVRPAGSIEERTRLCRRYVDAVDFDAIRRIADYEAMPPLVRGDDFGVSLGLSMVEQIEGTRESGLSHDDAVRVALASEVLRMKRGSKDG